MIDDSSIPLPVRPGAVLGGKYRVDRVLGAGGMGVVVAATHLQLDQRVALKFLLPDALQNPELVQRFAREARAAVRIRSEHVARVIDVGSLDTGAPYMVMEFLEGIDLHEMVQQGGALPTHIAVDFIVQACDAIGEAHSGGIVHRDLKPANLFIARAGDGSPHVKVLDFGISKMALGEDAGMTRTQAMMGSPLYMSPEHLSSSRDVDARTDIWALGVILHEMLSGNVPFSADTMPQLCVKIMSQPPPPIRSLRADVPPAVEGAIFRCLERDRAQRYPNVAALVHDLAPFGSPKTAHLAEKILRMAGAAPALSVRASLASLPSSESPQATGSTVAAPNAVSTTGFASVQTHATTKPPVRVSRLAITLGALLVAAACALLALGPLRRFVSPAAKPPAAVSALAAAMPEPSAPAVAPSAPPATASAPATPTPAIELKLDAQPRTATITIDDAAVGSNPYVMKVQPDGKAHRVRFEAPGYETQSHLVVFDRDVAIDAKLVRRPSGSRPSSPPQAYTSF